MLPTISLIELFSFWQVQAQAMRTNSHRCVTPLSHVTWGQTLLLAGAKAVAAVAYAGSKPSLLSGSTACLRWGPTL